METNIINNENNVAASSTTQTQRKYLVCIEGESNIGKSTTLINLAKYIQKRYTITPIDFEPTMQMDCFRLFKWDEPVTTVLHDVPEFYKNAEVSKNKDGDKDTNTISTIKNIQIHINAGLTVLISSQGDTASIYQKVENQLNKFVPDILVLATRTKGGPKKRVKEIAKNYGYTLIFLRHAHPVHLTNPDKSWSLLPLNVSGTLLGQNIKYLHDLIISL